jgi:hypothetical protein
VGATKLGTHFAFAVASTAAGENDYLTIQNPGTTAVQLNLTYYMGTTSTTKTISVTAGSRHTVEVFKTEEGAGPGFSSLGIVVNANQPILVEKPTYSANGASYGATDALGLALDAF